MKTTTLILTLSLLSLGSVAQKKYKEINFKDIVQETDDVVYKTNNGVADKESFKVKMKYENKSSDILLVKFDESVFQVNGQEIKPKEKQLIVAPGESDFRIINIVSAEFLTPKFNYVTNGVYMVGTNGTVQEAPEFKLPASNNEFTAGNFTCNMTSLTKETDKTEAKFECTYRGSKIGVINPSKAAVRMPDGSEIANEKKSSGPIMVQKNKTEKVTFKWNRMEGGKSTDMQKVEMVILFRKTFTETDPVKVKEESLEFTPDENLSK